MAISDYTVKNQPAPDMTADAFCAVLRAANSPVSDAEARMVYAYCVSRRYSPAALLAMFRKESSYGKAGSAVETHSFGNTRPPAVGVEAIGVTARNFSIFRDWVDGGISTVARLCDYAPYRGKETVRQIIPVWAPSSENDTEKYIADVLASIEGWVTPMAPRVAFSSGHHNKDSGNPYEYQTTGELVEALAAAARYQGLEVFVPQPDGPDADSDPGDGDYDGGLQAVARAVVAEHARKPFAVFLECHTEGVGNPDVRGIFGIYPNMGGDVDADARDKLIPAIVRKVRENVPGLALRGNGLMPESATGVGAQGFRLGVFAASASIRADCTRLLIEYGSHSNPAEAALQRTPQFYQGAARGTVEAICEFVGWPVKPWDAPTPQPPIQVEDEDSPEVHWYLDSSGEPVTEIRWGGRAKSIVGVNLADIGVSVIGMDDGTYDRSLQQGAFKPYVKRGA